MAIPRDERERVLFFNLGMHEGYRALKRACFPWAADVLDLFHLAGLLANAMRLERARRRLLVIFGRARPDHTNHTGPQNIVERQ